MESLKTALHILGDPELFYSALYDYVFLSTSIWSAFT